jgi:hypothetical protein
VKKEVKVATEPLKLYKILQKIDNTSPFYDKEYMPYTKYNSYRKIQILVGQVENGIHGLVTRDAARRWKRKSSILNTSAHKIVKCIIPPGAKYVLGTKGEIVASSVWTTDLQAI